MGFRVTGGCAGFDVDTQSSHYEHRRVLKVLEPELSAQRMCRRCTTTWSACTCWTATRRSASGTAMSQAHKLVSHREAHSRRRSQFWSNFTEFHLQMIQGLNLRGLPISCSLQMANHVEFGRCITHCNLIKNKHGLSLTPEANYEKSKLQQTIWCRKIEQL
jgi:hypothetical protein